MQTLTKKIVNNLIRILWEDNFDIVELFGSINAFGWGLWFFTHPMLFNSGAIYSVMNEFGSESGWGVLFIVIAVLKFTGVALDIYRFRRLIAMFATMVWIFLVVVFIQTNSHALLVFLTAQIATYSAWEYFRHAHKARVRKQIRHEIRTGELRP